MVKLWENQLEDLNKLNEIIKKYKIIKLQSNPLSGKTLTVCKFLSEQNFNICIIITPNYKQWNRNLKDVNLKFQNIITKNHKSSILSNTQNIFVVKYTLYNLLIELINFQLIDYFIFDEYCFLQKKLLSSYPFQFNKAILIDYNTTILSISSFLTHLIIYKNNDNIIKSNFKEYSIEKIHKSQIIQNIHNIIDFNQKNILFENNLYYIDNCLLNTNDNIKFILFYDYLQNILYFNPIKQLIIDNIEDIEIEMPVILGFLEIDLETLLCDKKVDNLLAEYKISKDDIINYNYNIKDSIFHTCLSNLTYKSLPILINNFSKSINKIKYLDKLYSDNEKCPICLEENTNVVMTCCITKFHGYCLDMWLKKNEYCPYCRSDDFSNLDINVINNNENIYEYLINNIEKKTIIIYSGQNNWSLGSKIHFILENNIKYKYKSILIDKALKTNMKNKDYDVYIINDRLLTYDFIFLSVKKVFIISKNIDIQKFISKHIGNLLTKIIEID